MPYNQCLQLNDGHFTAGLCFTKNDPCLWAPCEVVTIALTGSESPLQLSIKISSVIGTRPALLSKS